jgi:hypothetical protein
VTGECLCGAVRFAVDEPFVGAGFCHCTTCKKISGGVGTASGRVRTNAIRLLAGEEHVRTFQPAEGTAKSFCGICGSNLLGGGWPDSEWTSVRLSTLDEPVDVQPDSHTYVRSVVPWETLPDDGLPRHEGARPSA